MYCRLHVDFAISTLDIIMTLILHIHTRVPLTPALWKDANCLNSISLPEPSRTLYLFIWLRITVNMQKRSLITQIERYK